MKMKAAIFDLDGTILDSMEIWRDTAKRFLTERGIAPEENISEIVRTMSLEQAVRYLREKYGVTDSVESLNEKVDSMIANYYFTAAPLKPGTEEYLEKLRGQGVRMCIATATDRPLTEAALKRTGILDFFEFITTCQETGRGKNEPDIYINALEKLGTAKDETFVFEDALYAIRTAKAAGFPVVGVFDNYSRDHRELICALADYTAPDGIGSVNIE